MADYYYSGVSCIGQAGVVVLSSTTEYNIGDVVGGVPSFNCFTITALANSGDTVSYAIITSYTDCLSCYQSATGPSNAFTFANCTPAQSPTNLYLSVNDFTFVPQFGENYYLETTNGTSSCFSFNGFTQLASPISSFESIIGPYYECSVCIVENTPVTANTIYESCVICDPCLSGGTATSTAVPHPVWTGLYGNDVIQGNAVQLGGQNGLYS
jgi:hypothetical protein